MKRDPFVSTIICSHSRSAGVSECLNSPMPQIGPEAEVILVDSASDPKNEAELAKLASLFPLLKLIRVDHPGLSLARNRGVHRATADWIVFLDDDAVPFPDWLETLLATLTAASPTQAVIGGANFPKWPHGMNGRHLLERTERFLFLSQADRGGTAPRPCAVSGANLAI